MSVNAKQVILVSGQRLVKVEGSGEKLSPDIEQLVVVADNGVEAYTALESLEPGFRPLGFATLDDYESTAAKIRDAVSGKVTTGWKVVLGEGFQHKTIVVA